MCKLNQIINTLIVLMAVLFLNTVNAAPVFDGYFQQNHKKHADAWAEEDKKVDHKLAALEKKFGKKPNIIYVLADDVGWGEMGWQGGGKHRGTPTPELDQIALEGMRFWSAYAWGKWHLGEEPEYLPEAQGYDYAYYGLWNGAPDNWPGSYDTYADGPNSSKAMFYDFPGEEEYLARTGIDLSVAGYVGRKGKGRKPIEGVAGKLGPDRQEAFEAESIKQITAYIKENAKDDNPFFIYWATYALQLQGSKAHHDDKHVDRVNAQASEMAAHNAHMKQMLDTLKAEGIAENTLVVWISDNGPMYAFYPNSGYSWLRGGKGDVLEGGVRVPAMAWWPGMIAPNQDPIDILHITDLYTTAARIGGAIEHVPNDRITDGVDQTPLLLLGEDHGRRNMMFHYSGGVLGAIRYEDFKVHIKAGHGGLPGMDFYNVMRDPGEKFGQLYPGLFAVTPIQYSLGEHMKLIQKYPHRINEITPKGAELTPHD